jgi:putative tryptophan/tyrosine transport system substrate-binding protein
MKKAAALSILAAVMLLALVVIAEAQQPKKIHRMGFLAPGSPSLLGFDELQQGLRELGYVEGQNIVTELRSGEGKHERLPALATELVRLRVDVLVTTGPPGVRAAMVATTTIPIIMSRIDDAEEHGFVASLARPGGNVTGMSIQTGELSPKWIEFLREALPSASRVAVLWDTTGTVNQLRTLERAPHAEGVQLHVLKVQSSDDFAGAFAAATNAKSQGLVILGSALLTENAARLADLAITHRLPAIYNNRRFVQVGGLMTYGVKESDPSWGWRRAAVFVDKILKGAKPAELPVERPYKFELVVNLKTAKQMGLTIPPKLLARADQVIK